MNQLDKDIEHYEELVANSPQEIYVRLLSYMKELKMFRLRQIISVQSKLITAQSQLQLTKSELETYKRLQTVRQLQDLSQITKQG
jgi:hypothetical protein